MCTRGLLAVRGGVTSAALGGAGGGVAGVGWSSSGRGSLGSATCGSGGSGGGRWTGAQERSAITEARRACRMPDGGPAARM